MTMIKIELDGFVILILQGKMNSPDEYRKLRLVLAGLVGQLKTQIVLKVDELIELGDEAVACITKCVASAREKGAWIGLAGVPMAARKGREEKFAALCLAPTIRDVIALRSVCKPEEPEG